MNGAWIGGLAAGALGFAAGSAGAIITSTLVGAAVGGSIGAVGFPAFGLGNSTQGFIVGAIAGGAGGFARGIGLLGEYSVSEYKGGKLLKGIQEGINSLIKGLASPGSQSATLVIPESTEFSSFLLGVEPYVLGIGGGLYLDYTAYQCSQGSCNLPSVNQNWSF